MAPDTSIRTRGSGVTRVAAFLALLAVLGGGAALAGAALDPQVETAAPSGDGREGGGAMAAMNGADHDGTAGSPQGLAAVQDGYRLQLERTRLPGPGRAALALRILGPGGEALRGFDVEHGKRLHLILVRRDLRGFEHVHPAMDPDGTWRATVAPDAAGSYRVFADFSHAGTRRTLAADLEVAGRYAPRPLPAPARTARTASGLSVTLAAAPARAGREVRLAFTVRDRGRVVNDALGTYLGAQGHLVALREGDLAYLHVHPEGNKLAFMGSFPSAGAYRLWVQFRYRGRVETATFTREAGR